VETAEAAMVMAKILRMILQDSSEKSGELTALRRLEQDISQISHSNNISASRSETHALRNSSASRSETCVLNIDSTNLDFKFKPNNFDGSVLLHEFLTI